MLIDLVELPLEGAFKVKLDGDNLGGYLKRKPVPEERWLVHVPAGERTRLLKIEPHSREAAAALLVYTHYEEERKRLKQREASDARAGAEGDEVSE